MALNNRQEQFCREYLIDYNATQAALRSGYSARTAGSIGSENLKKPEILARVRELQREKVRNLAISEAFVINEIMETYKACRDNLDGKGALKALEMLSKHTNELDDPKGGKVYRIDPLLIADSFAAVRRDVLAGGHSEYVLPGGRGSTKSSFISIEAIEILKNNPQMHMLALRQVGNTLRDSVYNQLLWAIDALDLNDEFETRVSPLEITLKATGQKIYFRGADDPMKIKSIKVPFGYIGVLWFEELDQFRGPEVVRSIEQSAIRGGDRAYKFKSFNPPKTASNWANEYIKIPSSNRLVTHSTYKSVPPEWLGKAFLDDAEFLRQVNPDAYEHEYEGIANGNGGMVFDNVLCRQITDEEIGQFERVYHGVDWGWYPDPYHYAAMSYDPARLTLYIFDEYRCNKRSNRETADELFKRGLTCEDLIICDSAENKSVEDYRSYGLFARPAEKGPNSRSYGMKWLQSLRQIIIDPVRCPAAAREFLHYEYERDRDGNVISSYPDGNDHAIDAVRYAMSPVWRKKGR